MLLSFFLGAAASWAISHFYYTRSQRDAQDGLIASRLDRCIDGDKAFLIAVQTSSEPVPRYGTFTIEHVKKDGTTQRWTSGTKIMVRSVEQRVENCNVTNSNNCKDDHKATASLTERATECVAYLLRQEFQSARFIEFDSSDSTAYSQFVAEHHREPRRAVSA